MFDQQQGRGATHTSTFTLRLGVNGGVIKLGCGQDYWGQQVSSTADETQKHQMTISANFASNLKCVLNFLVIRYTESCRSLGTLGTSRWRNNRGT